MPFEMAFNLLRRFFLNRLTAAYAVNVLRYIRPYYKQIMMSSCGVDAMDAGYSHHSMMIIHRNCQLR